MERLEGLSDIDAATRERLRFLVYANGLTGVERFCRLPDGSRQENAAEHSWHVSLCALVLAPGLAPNVDLERVLKMLAVHDVVEVEVGDVPIYDRAGREAVAAIEREAARRVFGGVPDGAPLLELWEEFEAAATDEARFARAVDRLQPVLLHWIGGGRVWRAREITRAQLDEVVEIVDRLWPRATHLARAMIDDAARRGDFARGET